MINYDKLSDFEINKAVALKLGYEKVDGEEYSFNGEIEVLVNADLDHWETIDYCNNWNDIMPIAYEHGISLDSPLPNLDKTWMARFSGSIRTNDKNPRRAIAITYLKMMECEEN